MWASYDLVRGRLARDGMVAMATIIERRSSVPREVGAKMIVSPHDEIAGWTTPHGFEPCGGPGQHGGCGEGQVWRDALDVLRSGRPMITRVDGVMEVFVERLAPDEAPAAGGPTARTLLDRILKARAARERVVVATVVGGEAAPVGTRLLALGGGEWIGPAAPWVVDLEGPIAEALATGRTWRIRLLGDASLDVFLESLRPAPDLVIVGADHLAQPLATIGKALGFEVTVIDDRPDFAASARFPQADRVIADDPVAALARHPIGPGSYLLLVTRGHQLDGAALEAVIGADADYIGVIGSRRRVGAVFDHLRRAGVPEAAIARVHVPIGLDIEADTPAEIAVVIAAEIVNVRRGGRPGPPSAWTRRASF